MPALGLWGAPAPEPGNLQRNPPETLPRGTAAWRAQKSPRGTLSRDYGNLNRAGSIAKIGAYAERYSVRDSYSAGGTITLPSFSLLIGASESYIPVAQVILKPYSERAGYRESFASAKAGVGTFSELYQFKDLYAAQPAPPEGSTFGTYSSRAMYLESLSGRKNSRGTMATRISFRESYTGVAGPPPEPPPVGVLSDEPLDTRIGSPYVGDVHQRIGTPVK